MDYAALIDHTILAPQATKEQVKQLCGEAMEYGFHSVCVNSSFVYYCAQLLKDSHVKVCTVIGFPLGAMSTAGKVAEAEQAMADGASELDMVIHVGMIKSGKAAVKVILETCLLTEQEKTQACRVCRECGADFVKTSTGFSKGGATAEDVALMRRMVGPEMGVKASGGIRSLEDARAMVEAGANRLGTSSGAAIVKAQE